MYEGVALAFPLEPEEEAVIVPEPEFDAAVWGDGVGTLIANAQQAAFEQVMAHREEAAPEHAASARTGVLRKPIGDKLQQTHPSPWGRGRAHVAGGYPRTLLGLRLRSPKQVTSARGLDH